MSFSIHFDMDNFPSLLLAIEIFLMIVFKLILQKGFLAVQKLTLLIFFQKQENRAKKRNLQVCKSDKEKIALSKQKRAQQCLHHSPILYYSCKYTHAHT